MGGRRGKGTRSTGASERNGGRREGGGLRSGAAAYNARRTTTLLRHVSLSGCLAKGSVVKLAAAERMQAGYRKELSSPTGVRRRRKRADGGKRAERRRTWARRATELGDRLPYKVGCSITTAYNSGRWAGEGVRGHARGCRTDAGKLQEGALSTNLGVKTRRNEADGGRASGTTGDVSWTGSGTRQPPALPGGLQYRYGV